MVKQKKIRKTKNLSANVKKVMEIAQDQTKFSQPEHSVIVQEDCLNFLQTLPDNSVDIIITDPAYSGMNQKLKFGNGRIVGQYQKEDNDKWFKEFHDTEENYQAFLSECKRILKDNCATYIMFDSYSLLSLGNLVRKYFDVKNIIVWDKVNMGMGHNFRRRHEFIIYATKGKTKLTSRGIPDVWQIKRILKSKYPTQKPVEVFENMLKASTKIGDVVCDPFVGSGSSAVAALRNGCYFIGSDVCQEACRLTRDRIKFFLTEGYDKFQPEIKGSQQKSLHGF